MSKSGLILCGLALCVFLVGCPALKVKPYTEKKLTATIQTNKGEIQLELYASKTPITVANFVNLALRGYYDGIKFHRVIDNFMIQTGDPQGTGFGGPGYGFEDEILPELRTRQPGYSFDGKPWSPY